MGIVDNVKEFYDSIDLVVLPLGPSTGQKIKTVESLYYQKPFIATFDAFSGIPVCDSDRKYIFESIDEVCASFNILNSDISTIDWIRDILNFSRKIYAEYLSFIEDCNIKLVHQLHNLPTSGTTRLVSSDTAERYCAACDEQSILIQTLKAKCSESEEYFQKFKSTEKKFKILLQEHSDQKNLGDLPKSSDAHNSCDSINLYDKGNLTHYTDIAKASFKSDYFSSTHLILCPDWNGGELFFQWILTLCEFIKSLDPECNCILLLGPNATTSSLNKISFPSYIRLCPYSDSYLESILSSLPPNSLIPESINIYAHGWDGFSVDFFNTYAKIMGDLVRKIHIYSDATKPQTSVRSLDQFHWLKHCSFDQLILCNFTPIPDAHTSSHLLEKS